MKRLLLVSSFWAALGACADDVPSTPSFQQHVAPILQANCVRCHSAGQRQTQSQFRLTYSPVMTATRTTPGARALAEEIALRVEERRMPPRIPLDDDQIETIVRWAQDAERGPARPGNRAPVATVVQTLPDGLIVDIRDPDGDLVGGYLSEDGAPSLEVTQGRNELRLAPGNRDLVLHLDDGGAEFDIPLGVSP